MVPRSMRSRCGDERRLCKVALISVVSLTLQVRIVIDLSRLPCSISEISPRFVTSGHVWRVILLSFVQWRAKDPSVWSVRVRHCTICSDSSSCSIIRYAKDLSVSRLLFDIYRYFIREHDWVSACILRSVIRGMLDKVMLSNWVHDLNNILMYRSVKLQFEERPSSWRLGQWVAILVRLSLRRFENSQSLRHRSLIHLLTTAATPASVYLPHWSESAVRCGQQSAIWTIMTSLLSIHEPKLTVLRSGHLRIMASKEAERTGKMILTLTTKSRKLGQHSPMQRSKASSQKSQQP